MTPSPSTILYEFSYWSLAMVLLTLCCLFATLYMTLRAFKAWRTTSFSKARRDARHWLIACIFALLWISLLSFHWAAKEGAIIKGVLSQQISTVSGEVAFYSCYRVARIRLLNDSRTYLAPSCKTTWQLAAGQRIELSYVRGFYGDSEIIRLNVYRGVE